MALPLVRKPASANEGGEAPDSRAFAKAWVRFNGAGVIAASYNVASVVRDGSDTGDWIITFITPMASTAYVALVTASDNVAAANGGVSFIGNAYNYTTTQVRVSTANHANAAADTTFTSVVVFGDQ